MKIFEKIKINLKDGKSRQIRLLGLPIIQYDKFENRKTKYYIPFLQKQIINKEKPVFYLKVNRNESYVFTCLQHWIDTIEEMGATFFILCDKNDLEVEILKQNIFINGNIKFLKSIKNNRIKNITKNISTPHWYNATYAHLTTFFHSFKNDIISYWNIDADDTLFCIEKTKLKEYLQEIQYFANKKKIKAFSLDMHRSRMKGKHWSFGITYITNDDIDWIEILKKNKNTEWRKNYLNFDYEFNLDWFFTYLKDNNKINIQTYYIEKIFFIHFGDFINNPIYAWYGFYNDKKLNFPILNELYGSKKYGDIDIFNDVIAFDFGHTLKKSQDFIKGFNNLEVSSKPHDNMWG